MKAIQVQTSKNAQKIMGIKDVHQTNAAHSLDSLYRGRMRLWQTH